MDERTLLFASAVSIAAVHTLLGPDHYVPFAAMARVGRWSMRRTMLITALCGVGHVLGSVALGVVGLSLGWAVFRLDAIESVRGAIAGWLLIAFGLVYFAWGLIRGVRNRPHSHLHVHEDGTMHTHEHVHVDAHLHPHTTAPTSTTEASTAHHESMTPWVLFTIFLFGPCEPLIPLLMYPAARGHPLDVVIVTLLFGAVTIATMLVIVASLTRAAATVRLTVLARFHHAAAGLVILACGVAVKAGM